MNIQVFKNDKPVEEETSLIYHLAIRSFLGMWGIVDDDIEITVELELDNKYIDQEKRSLGGVFRKSERKFIIIINKEILKESVDENDSYSYMAHLMNILAHECVHIKQYVYEELDCSWGLESMFWHGEDVSGIDYEQLPFEIEAYEHQDTMREHFFHEMVCIPNLDEIV